MTVKYVVLSEEIRDEIEKLRKVATKIRERLAELPDAPKEKRPLFRCTCSEFAFILHKG